MGIKHYLVLHPTNRLGGLVHPSYKWTNLTYPIYNQCYNPPKRFVGSSPSSKIVRRMFTDLGVLAPHGK